VSDLTPIAGKLGTFIRLLASDKEGEVRAAVAALLRTLKAAGTDIHAVADLIEKPANGKLSQADMERIFKAGHELGYEKGVRDAENKSHGSLDFRGVDGSDLDWHAMALWCQKHGDRLSGTEEKFVNDVAARTVYRVPSEKQCKWLKSIFLRLGGRL
jgi:hypothetical protein